MKHAMIVAAALAVLSGTAQVAVAADGKAVYDKACGSCHNKGLMLAPKLGDKEKWATLAKGGNAALDASVIKGKGKMPAKGGNAALTDAEIKAANEYILSQAK